MTHTLKLLFLTLDQFSFVLITQNIIFPILVDWYFAYETIIRQPEGIAGYLVHQGTWLCYLMNFIIKITPTCGHFKISSQPLLNIKTYFFHMCEHSMETWSQDLMDNLPNNGSMTFDKFTCTNIALGGHFQLTSNAWSNFFCSHYAKYYFPYFW